MPGQGSHFGGITLVCFAVEQEARPFRRLISDSEHVTIAITGIGAENAERCVRREMASRTPAMVISAGFAGALNPALDHSAVVFDAEPGFELITQLIAAGAQPATFHCAEKVVLTAQVKNMLRHLTRRDAVEMESKIIRSLCAERGIPSATVRVISDTADENLPLDFNSLLGKNNQIDYGKLARTLLQSPLKIWELLVFARRVRRAAQRLASVLSQTIFASRQTG